MLTRDEVIWGYRYILGREPESIRVINKHSRSHSNWRHFRDALLRSTEFSVKTHLCADASKWVACEILSGRRVIWVDLADDFVSRGSLFDCYEPLESEFLRQNLRADSVFLDIGANVGWFTLLASTIIGDGGHVHAFEPRHPTVQYLKRSVAMNHLESMVTVHELGLDCTEGHAQLGYERGTRNPGHSFLVDEDPQTEIEVQAIRTDALDHFHFKRIDVVKLDVEGAEMRVLKGGEATITANRPTVLSEIYPEQLKSVSKATPSEYIGWYKARGYSATIVDKQRYGEVIDNFPPDWYKELISVAFKPVPA